MRTRLWRKRRRSFCTSSSRISLIQLPTIENCSLRLTTIRWCLLRKRTIFIADGQRECGGARVEFGHGGGTGQGRRGCGRRSAVRWLGPGLAVGADRFGAVSGEETREAREGGASEGVAGM